MLVPVRSCRCPEESTLRNIRLCLDAEVLGNIVCRFALNAPHKRQLYSIDY